MEKIKGLVAAPFSVMNEKGEINFDKIGTYYEFLKTNGIKGAFINGSSGEGASLSLKEKQKIAENWVKTRNKNKGLKIINMVGGTSYREGVDIAQMSKDLGVDAISIIAPYYFKPVSAGQLSEFCAKIAESVPSLPVYFYHIPALTGCYISMFDFLKEAHSMIPNLTGIKYTHEDLMDFINCLNFENGKYDMLWGRDETLLSALVLGALGGVGSTYNYAAPLYMDLINAFNEGQLTRARELQQMAVNMIMLLGKYGGIPTGKAYMRYIGFDCGPFRLPFKNMNKDEYAKFASDVRHLKMEKYFSKYDHIEN